MLWSPENRRRFKVAWVVIAILTILSMLLFTMSAFLYS